MKVITDTTSLPEQFESVEEAADFWDTHSLADHWDQIHEVEVEGVLAVGGGSRWTRMCASQVTFSKAAPACPRAFGCFLAVLLISLDRLWSFREGASPCARALACFPKLYYNGCEGDHRIYGDENDDSGYNPTSRPPR